MYLKQKQKPVNSFTMKPKPVYISKTSNWIEIVFAIC